MATTKKGGDDPIAKIGEMIDAKINAAFEGRERKETESKDPWARLEGIVDRAIGKRFEDWAKGMEEALANEGEPAGDPGKPRLVRGDA